MLSRPSKDHRLIASSLEAAKAWHPVGIQGWPVRLRASP